MSERTETNRILGVAPSLAIVFAGHVATVLAGFVTVVLVSRVLGAEALGRWRFAQVILTYLTVVSDLGLTALAVRAIASHGAETSRYAGPVVVVRVLVAVPLAVLASFAVVLASDLSWDARVFYLMAIATSIPVALSLLHVLQGRERFLAFALTRTGVTAGATLLGLGTLLVTHQLIALVAWPLVAWIASGLILAAYTRRRLGVALVAGSLETFRSLVKAGQPFLVAAIAIQLVSNADALIIGAVRGEADLGIYSSAYLLAGQLLFLAGPIATVVYPRLAAEHAAGQHLGRRLAEVLGLLGLVVIPVCLAIAVLHQDIFEVLYGPSFERGAALLAVLAGLPAVGFYNVGMAQALMAIGAQRQVMIVSIIAAGLSVGLNAALVPLLGLPAAAVVAVVTELVSATAYTVLGRGALGSWPTRAYASGLVVALPGAAVLQLSRTAGLAVPVALGLATLVVAGMVIAWRPRALEPARTAVLAMMGRQRLDA